MSDNVQIRFGRGVEIEGLPAPLVQYFKTQNVFDNPQFAALARLGNWTGDTEPFLTPMGKAPRVKRAVGRITRPAPGKTTATVYDFIDELVPALAAARGRARLYARS